MIEKKMDGTLVSKVLYDELLDYLDEKSKSRNYYESLRPRVKIISVGDVDFDSCFEKCSLITPPTGGVGPMTICMLAYNTAKAKYGDEVEEVLDRGIEKAKMFVKKG